MDLTIDGVTIDIPNLTLEDSMRIHNILAQGLSNSTLKVREVIQKAFSYAISISPNANPSDIWHHVIYRYFLNPAHLAAISSTKNLSQSWVRNSGPAFELFLQEYYNPRLAPHGVQLQALFGNPHRFAALHEMDISDKVSNGKLDLSIRCANDKIIGGIHAKVSLAERVTDDVPASVEMMAKGFFSPLVTLDVKSYPGMYINKGELGTATAPTDKRRYIENHGRFSLCLSYNQRTNPSPPTTPSGMRIHTTLLNAPFPDPLEDAILSYRHLCTPQQ